jgi:hypothetical protein
MHPGRESGKDVSPLGGPRTQRSEPGARLVRTVRAKLPRCRVSSRGCRDRSSPPRRWHRDAEHAPPPSSSSAACCAARPDANREQISTAAASPMDGTAYRIATTEMARVTRSPRSAVASSFNAFPESARIAGIGSAVIEKTPRQRSQESARRERGRANRCAARSSFRRSAGSRGRRRRGGA